MTWFISKWPAATRAHKAALYPAASAFKTNNKDSGLFLIWVSMVTRVKYIFIDWDYLNQKQKTGLDKENAFHYPTLSEAEWCFVCIHGNISFEKVNKWISNQKLQKN